MTEKLAAKVAGHADAGELAVRTALDAALAAQRCFDAAAEKQREVVRCLTDASAAFAAVRAAAVPPEDAAREAKPAGPPKSPAPPPPKADPNRPESGGGRATRSGAFLAALAVGLGSLSAGPHYGDLAVTEESGKAALRRGNFVKAETLFARAGDELGLAEALVCQKRYDEAALVCERYPTDAKAWLFLGLIARAKGDAAGGLALLKESRTMGNAEARDLLAAEGVA